MRVLGHDPVPFNYCVGFLSHRPDFLAGDVLEDEDRLRQLSYNGNCCKAITDKQ